MKPSLMVVRPAAWLLLFLASVRFLLAQQPSLPVVDLQGAGMPVMNCTTGQRYLQTDGSRSEWRCTATNVWSQVTTLNAQAYGAKCDNSTDDIASIQAAISAAKLLGYPGLSFDTGHAGAKVKLPIGICRISSPIILPRTGTYYNPVVLFEGDNERGTALGGTAAFPANRALIEWDLDEANWPGGDGRTAFQSIRNLTLILPDVSGSGGIHYALKHRMVYTVTVVNPGDGCTGSGITFAGFGGTGAGATGTVTLSAPGEHVVSVTVTAGGNHYLYPTTAAISGCVTIQPVVTVQTVPPTAADSWSEKLMSPVIENIYITGRNTFGGVPAAEYGIFLEGTIHTGLVSRITGNPSLGTNGIRADLILVKSDTYDWGSAGSDGTGFEIGSVLENLSGQTGRGGGLAIFQGRLVNSVLRQSYCDGTLGIPCYDFVNSDYSRVENISNEGRSDSPQVRCTGCRNVTFTGIYLGTPNVENQCGTVAPWNFSCGIGNGIEFIASTDNTVEAISRIPGAPSFSLQTPAVKQIALDVNSHRNTFTRILSSGAADSFAAEMSVSDLATNLIRGYRLTGAALDSIGANTDTLWHKYALVSIANGVNGCANATGCWQINGVLGANRAAALTQSVVLFGLPVNGFVSSIREKTTVVCSGTTTATLTLGTTGSTGHYRSTAYNIAAAVSDTNVVNNIQSFGSDTVAATNVVAAITTTAGAQFVDTLAADCAVDFWLLWGVLP